MQVVYTYRVIAGPDEHYGLVCGGFAGVLGFILMTTKPDPLRHSSGTGQLGTLHAVSSLPPPQSTSGLSRDILPR